jgi:metal-responsive CopG/Arc/MetJ family transcriptional regulator
MSSSEEKIRVMLTIRKDYMEALDEIITKGGASSRSDLFERIIGAFLEDLRKKRQREGALGAFVGFLILMGVAGVIASILGGDDEE